MRLSVTSLFILCNLSSTAQSFLVIIRGLIWLMANSDGRKYLYDLELATILTHCNVDDNTQTIYV